MDNSSWALAAVTIAVIAVVVAFVSSCGSGSTRTTTVTTTVKSSAAPHQTSPPTAVVAFEATKLADGASGTVAISPAGKSELRLMITLAVPHYSSYGIALWSDRNHWQGLYTGARGTNTQTLVLGAQTLLRYRLLDIGQQIVRGRVAGRGLIRLDSKSVVYHHLLYVSTSELLNRLLATTQ
jgi:hypothetical protein